MGGVCGQDGPVTYWWYRGHVRSAGELNGASAGNGEALSYQGRSLSNLLGGDQIKGPHLVILTPTAPVAQGLHVTDDFTLGGNPGILGHSLLLRRGF